MAVWWRFVAVRWGLVSEESDRMTKRVEMVETEKITRLAMTREDMTVMLRREKKPEQT